MHLAHILRHVALAFFLLITACAFLLTAFHVSIPIFPPIVRFSYGMMAPYQGYERLNQELLADGQTTDGAWHGIDLSPYFPVIRGEAAMRENFLIFSGSGTLTQEQLADRTARKILSLERAHGHAYTAVRLSFHQWQPSPLGYNALSNDHSFLYPLAIVHE